MKKLVLALIGLCVLQFGSAQTASIEFGKELKINASSDLQPELLTNGDLVFHYTMFKIKDERRKTFYYPSTGDLSIGKPVVYNPKKKGGVSPLAEFYTMGDDLGMITYREDKNTKKLFYEMQVVNPVTLAPKGKRIELGRVDYGAVKGSRGLWGRNRGSFAIYYSPDSSKILAVSLLPYLKKESERFSFHVLDNDWNTLWKKDVELSYSDEEFGILDVIVNNEGNVFLLGNIDKTKAEKRAIKKETGVEYNKEFKALCYYDKGERLVDLDLKLDNKIITDIRIDFDVEQNLVCTGFYSEGGGGIKGVFYQKTDSKTSKVIAQSMKEFPIDMIVQEMSIRKAEKEKKKDNEGKKSVEFYSYDLKHLIQKEDGGMLLVAEQYRHWTTTYTYTSANGSTTTSTTHHYLYADILTINISKEGKIGWMDIVDKHQYSTNDGGVYSSFQLVVSKDKVHYVYLKKSDEKKTFMSTSGKDLVMSSYTMDGTSSYTPIHLYDKKQILYFRPSSAIQTDTDEVKGVAYLVKGKGVFSKRSSIIYRIRIKD